MYFFVWTLVDVKKKAPMFVVSCELYIWWLSYNYIQEYDVRWYCPNTYDKGYLHI